MTDKLSVIVPNWNAKSSLGACLDSLATQSQSVKIIVVDNGSTDGSAEFVSKNYPDVTLAKNEKNLGFAGGVNIGIKIAIKEGCKYVALLNNDAIADGDWLKNLADFAARYPDAGIVTSKMYLADGKHLDSTGEIYTTWGLPFPRGRNESATNKYDKDTWVFGASGGASLYRAAMLEEIGLFDEDFFAYYEDVDISFRAQLAGWKVGYEPKAVVYHQIGGTSGKIAGFTTYQTIKNLPFLFWKNVPTRLLPVCLLRFFVAYSAICLSAYSRGQFWPTTKGLAMAGLLLPKKLAQRYKIQSRRKVSTSYLNSILLHDLPPNAKRLRRLRSARRSIG